MDRQRMERLAALISMKADVDLAALAAVAAHKNKIEAMRAEVEAGVAQAFAAVVECGELAGFQSLEGHMIFANGVLDRLGEAAARLEVDRRKCRDLAAISFGRATVLGDICAAKVRKTAA